MKYISIKKNEKGFSILELLVAVTVLSIGLLGLAALQGSTIKRNASAMRNTEAIALLEDKIEEYRSKSFETIDDEPIQTGLGEDGIFNRTCSVQNGVPIPGSTKTVTVKVSWADPGSHSLSFQTVFSN